MTKTRNQPATPPPEKRIEAIRPDGLDENLVLAERVHDWRLIEHGIRLPTLSYADQPYLLQTNEGHLLCVVTTGAGQEGEAGQHVCVLLSSDEGRSWSGPWPVEPPEGPESSYAVLLKAPSGRIFCFYNYNIDNLREIPTELPGNPPTFRMDTLGAHVFRFSDDHGRTWSQERYPVPVRETEIDRRNVTGGRVRFFWNVGRPFVLDGAAYLSIHKVGNFGEGFLAESEGWLVRSPNLLTEADPGNFQWETLPEGEVGLKALPGEGRVAEEQNYTVLGDGSIHAVYRTLGGYLTESYSRDGGRSWSPPQHQCYADGRPMKNPRAAAFGWKLSNGKFLQWFHNHGGPFIHFGLPDEPIKSPYEDRNPVWIAPGMEIDGVDGKIIQWGQPEIFLYHDDPRIRMSYPDLIETRSGILVSETQKNAARLHGIDRDFLRRIFAGLDHSLSLGDAPLAAGGPGEHPAPRLPEFSKRDYRQPDHRSLDLRQGFTVAVELAASADRPAAGALLDARTPSGVGWVLSTFPDKSLTFLLSDGQTTSLHSTDPGTLPDNNSLRHVVVIVDGGPKIVRFVINALLYDGGSDRQFGWSRFSPHLASANGSERLRASPQVECFAIYGRPLLTCEAALARIARG